MKKVVIKTEKDGYYTVMLQEFKMRPKYFLALKKKRSNWFLTFILGGKHIITYGFGYTEPSEDKIIQAHNYLINTYT